MKTSLTILIIIIALLGVGVSVYALQLHNTVEADTFCNINETFNCDIVNKGQYSEVVGIPVALFGIVGYLAIIIGALISTRISQLWEYIMLASGFGLAFALYLTSLEIFVIQAYCLVCLASQLLILLAFILSLMQFRYVRHNIS